VNFPSGPTKIGPHKPRRATEISSLSFVELTVKCPLQEPIEPININHKTVLAINADPSNHTPRKNIPNYDRYSYLHRSVRYSRMSMRGWGA
jgi:hypothetical protein